MKSSIAFVLQEYPKYSQTFIAQEVLALEKLGLDILLVSLNRPAQHIHHPVHKEIKAGVLQLSLRAHRSHERVLRAWRKVREWPALRRARAAFMRDFARDHSRRRLACFRKAVVLAAELDDRCQWMHAHFMTQAAAVTRYAAMLRDLPWSCSAHAYDIWTSADWEKKEIMARSRWTVTCTKYNLTHLKKMAPKKKVFCLYHGIDLGRFSRPPRRSAGPSGRSARHPVVILSVGRAVDKKGYRDLIRALALLPRDLHWSFVHIGAGEELKSLRTLAGKLGIRGRISWLGARRQGAVLEHYRRAHIFALACRVSENGNRDGLPNVLVEAQSQRLAVVSTAIAGIPEVIRSGSNGLLVGEKDPPALSRALLRLIRNPGLRKKMGREGEKLVRSSFGHKKGAAVLADMFLEI